MFITHIISYTYVPLNIFHYDELPFVNSLLTNDLVGGDISMKNVHVHCSHTLVLSLKIHNNMCLKVKVS